MCVMSKVKSSRYCKQCEEFFTLTPEQVEASDVRHWCGEEAVPSEEAGVKSDFEIYGEENKGE